MTAMAHATSPAVTEWSKIFPRQVTESHTSSVTFMKQLTSMAVSTITYLKGIFSDDNYIINSYSGMRIMTLKSKCDNELAQFFSASLAQAFEAFDKKYLHQLALCFYDGKSKLENLVEYHMFEYTYKEGGVSMSVSSRGRDMRSAVTCTLSSVQAQTAQLIRTCVVTMQMCKQGLPDPCDVSLRLYYTNDAPEGYQAPGYHAASPRDDPAVSTWEDTVMLGFVETPFHKLVFKTYIRDNTGASHEAIPSLNPPRMTQAEDLSTTVNSERNNESDASGVRLQCACNNYDCDDDVPAALLTCQYCKTQQHAACYGLTAAGAARRAGHTCVPCASAARDSREPTDPMLANIDDSKRKSLALFRRSLELCSRVPGVAARDLLERLGLSRLSTAKLMKMLDREGIIRQEPNSDFTTTAKINPDKLKMVQSRYFKSVDEDDLVDRLVAETLEASQGSQQADPLGDVLSPTEKTSLQNASQVGRVIPPQAKNNAKAPALKQYRDALVMIEKMDVNSPINDLVMDMEKLEKKSAKRKMGKVEKVFTGVKTKRAKVSST